MSEEFKKWCKDTLDPNADPMAALWLSEAFDGGYQAATLASDEKYRALVEAAYREGWRESCPSGERGIHAEDFDWEKSQALVQLQGGERE